MALAGVIIGIIDIPVGIAGWMFWISSVPTHFR